LSPPGGRAGIVVNGAFVTQKITGPQRYAIELARRLLHEEGVRIAVPADIDLDWLPAARRTVLRGPPFARDSWGWANVSLPRTVTAGEVLWSPTPRAPLRTRAHVVTMHDVAVLEHPEWYSRAFHRLYRVALPVLARSSSGIVTSSQFSKGRIVDVLSVPAEKVSVVRGGVDERFTPSPDDRLAELRDRYGLPERFVLALGTLQPRKNLARLVEAWARLPEPTRREWGLVLTGEAGPQFAGHGVTGNGRPDLRIIGYVPDADLPALYSAASVFAYPSLYEGFGLPPLEAMRCGTPVLAGSEGACAEILGDHALLVDPKDTAALADGLRHLIADDSARSRLGESGQAHACGFDWNRSARQLLELLRAQPPRR
jgi:glycosyltransferase involved in cell wall biosynthesis